jgi:hypothetical protein
MREIWIQELVDFFRVIAPYYPEALHRQWAETELDYQLWLLDDYLSV